MPDQDRKCVAAAQSQHVVSLSCWEPHGPRARRAIITGVPQILFTSILQNRYPSKSHSTDLQRTHPDPKSAPLELSLRRAVQLRARTSRPALPQGAPAHVCIALSAPHVTLVRFAVSANITQGTLSSTMCTQKARCPSLVKSQSPAKGSRRRGPRSRFAISR